MKLKIALNQKSIKNAINTLKTVKKQLQGEMLDEFYKRCYDYFVSHANYYLLSSGIGDLVIAEIQSSWKYVPTMHLDIIGNNISTYKGGVKFINTAEKSVYVEFGVGVVGEENEHPNANNTNYKYNIPSDSKDIDNSWMFKSFEEELDIPQKAIVGSKEMADGRLKVWTYGTQGCFYAFNALEDLRKEVPNIWKEIKIKYWG